MKILIVRLSSLGDVVLTTPVMANLKAAWPQAHISMLVKEKFSDVFIGNTDLDEVLVFEKHGLWGWVKKIREQKYDLYIDLHSTLRSGLIGFFSKIPRRIRYNKKTWQRRLLVWFKWESCSLGKNVSERYLACLEKLPIPVERRQLVLRVSQKERLSEAWEKRLGTGPLIGVAPGAAHATKRWLPENFAAAADELAGHMGGERERACIVLLGAASDQKAAWDVLRYVHGPVQDLTGQTSLKELILIAEKCSMILTNDSGVLHVAAALNAPAVAVFGPTVKAFGFFPESDGVRVVENNGLSCRPCTLHGSKQCPRGHFKCMKDISIQQVVGAGLASAR